MTGHDGAIRRFVERAEAYCELVECCQSFAPRQFALLVAAGMARLYEAGLDLPLVDADLETDVVDAVGLSGERAVNRDLSAVFRGCDFYFEFYDPYEDGHPSCGMLTEDMVSIYRDVKNGLLAYRRGERRHEIAAIWEWRFGLESHWGRHLVSAQRALHWAMFDYRIADDSPPAP